MHILNLGTIKQTNPKASVGVPGKRSFHGQLNLGNTNRMPPFVDKDKAFNKLNALRTTAVKAFYIVICKNSRKNLRHKDVKNNKINPCTHLAA